MHAMREAASDNSKAGWTFPQQMCHLFKYFFHLWIILPSSRVSHAKTKRPWEWLPRPFSSLRKRPVNGQQPDLLCKSKLTNPISASKRDLKWCGGSALISPFVERRDVLSWSEGSLMRQCCLELNSQITFIMSLYLSTPVATKAECKDWRWDPKFSVISSWTEQVRGVVWVSPVPELCLRWSNIMS